MARGCARSGSPCGTPSPGWTRTLTPSRGSPPSPWSTAGGCSSRRRAPGPAGRTRSPWEARPVVVKRTAHVVAVISKEDEEIAPHLLDLAERGMVNAAKVRPDGWPGKVLVTAVSDQKVFESYFAGSRDKLAQVEAVTVPRYNEVPEWDRSARFTLSRVVFNPETLGRGDEELQHTRTHEFAHLAFGPVTSDATPVWLIEGMAEYVAFASE